MRIAFAIYDSGRYKPGVDRLVKALEPYGYPVIVRSAYDTDIPRGKEGTWLDVAYAWFEVLGWEDYDRIIVLDADLLIIGDISYLFSEEITGWLGMCKATYCPYQAGLVVVNRTLFDADKVLSEWIPMINEQEWKMADQSVIDAYIKRNPDFNVQLLPKEYNWLAVYGDATKDTRILHFHGVPKPWESGYTYKHPFHRYWFNKDK